MGGEPPCPLCSRRVVPRKIERRGPRLLQGEGLEAFPQDGRPPGLRAAWPAQASSLGAAPA